MGNFRKFPGNFLETVRVVTGHETVRVGMWSPICLMSLKNINVIYAVKVFHQINILKTTKIFILVKNLISVNFVQQVLPVLQQETCTRGDILGTIETHQKIRLFD